MIKKRKIAFVNGTRADFGLMKPILKGIERSEKLSLQFYACGMHLMPEFGKTINIVKKDFPNVKILPAIIKKDSPLGMAEYFSELNIKIVNAFKYNRPDFLLVVGDRIEMLCAAVSCLYLGIPVAHIHGGDISATFDNSARHSITKIAHLHFVPTEQAMRTVKQMGEEDWRIFLVGAPSLDTIVNLSLPTKKQLYQKLKIPENKKIILVTQHPVSEEINEAERQIKETLEAIKKFNLPIVLIYPNADPGGRRMIKIIKKEKKNPQFRIFSNIEYSFFLALEREAAVWVGNSSAGLIDSPYFHTPVVNIGIRQLDRLKAENIINVPHNREKIYLAIKKALYDKNFLNKVKRCKNPWGNGKATPKIVKILETIEIDKKLMLKKFICRKKIF